MNARETSLCVTTYFANHIGLRIYRCAQLRNKISKCRKHYHEFSLLITKYVRTFFFSQSDRQMTEIFVSGTEVFSHAKMTETPYELRRVDMYESMLLKFPTMSKPILFPCKVGLVFMQIFPIRSFYIDLQGFMHLESLFRPIFCIQIHNIPSFCRLCISSLGNNMAP